MPRKNKTRVFISYSRHDEALVKPLGALLGVATEDAVFLDVSSLKPGDSWEDEIIKAVKESSVFVLCWCCESKKSTFIAKEISAALSDKRKRLVPVLFCPMELPPEMAGKQWIDLRGSIRHDCTAKHETRQSGGTTHEKDPYRSGYERSAEWAKQTRTGAYNIRNAGALGLA